MNSKVVQSVMNSRSAQKVAEFFVEKGRSAQDFFNLPESEMEQQLVAKYRKAQASAREFINKTKTAVTEDTDFKNFQHDIQEGMADIASIAKKIWRGEATDEDIANFQAAMKVRAKSLGQTAKSAGQRGYAAGKKTYGRAKVKAAEIKSMIQTNVNGFLETEKGQKVLEKFRQAKAKYGTVHDKVGNKLGPVRTAVKNALGKAADVTTEEIDNLIDELDRVDRGEATTGSSKVLSAYDKVKAGMGTARDAMSDPKKAAEAAKKTWDKIKKLFEKPIEHEQAQLLYNAYVDKCEKQGVTHLKFMEWCKAFDIKIKGQGPFSGGIRGFFQWTRKKDREIWTKFMGGAMLAPFRFVGGMFSNTRIGNTIGKIPLVGKLTGLSGKGSAAAGAGNLAAKAGGLAMSAGLGLGKAATEMMPAPMRMLVQAPFTAIGAMATGMGEILKFMGFRTKQEDAEKKKQEKLKKKQEKQDKEKNKSGGWLNRLKFWGKKKDEDSGKGGEKKGFLARLKEFKTPLTIMGGILGVFGLCKMLNIGVQDLIKGVTSVVSTIASVTKGIYDFFGGGFTGILGVLGAGLGVKALANLAIKGLGKLAWGATKGLGKLAWKGIKGAGKLAWAGVTKLFSKAKKPKVSIDAKGRARDAKGRFVKQTKINVPKAKAPTVTPKKVPGGAPKLPGNGGGILASIIRKIKDVAGWAAKPFIWAFEKAKEKIGKLIDKINKGWQAVKSKFKMITKAITKPKVITRVGKTAIGKFAAKIGCYLASATGFGMILSIGLAIWDIIWICKYVFMDDKSLPAAICLQFLGVDLTDPKEQEALEIDENKLIAEADQNSEQGAIGSEEELGERRELGDGGFFNFRNPISVINDTWDNFTGKHSATNVKQNDSVISLLTQIRDILAAGISVSPGSSSATFASNGGYSSSSSGDAANSSPIAGLGPNVEGSTKAERAASMAQGNTSKYIESLGGGNYGIDKSTKVSDKGVVLAKDGSKASTTSVGRCATYVNKAITDAGYEGYTRGDGWQVGNSLAKIGWQKVAFDPNHPEQFKPQKGDVVSFGRAGGSDYISDGNNKYGHAAIYNGNKWVSDFVQNEMSPYTRNATKKKISYRYATVWRDPANSTGSGVEMGSGDSNISSYDRAKYSNRATSLSSSVASKTSTSGNTKSVINIDTSSVSNILQESYKVHVASRDLLQEIRDAVVANTQTTQAAAQQAQQPANNVMPESAIRLQHNSYNFG